MCWSTVTKKSEDQRERRGNKTERRKTTDMEAAREHGNQVPMRNAHARHKLSTYSYTRVKEVVQGPKIQPIFPCIMYYTVFVFILYNTSLYFSPAPGRLAPN